MRTPEPLRERILRFARSSAVGVMATIVDFAILALCLHVFHLKYWWLAKVFSLTAGTTTQFVGSRYFAFRAQQGRLGRQIRWFLVAEAFAFAFTVIVFQGLVSSIAYLQSAGMIAAAVAERRDLIANAISGSIVYFGFSYPLWKRVFTVAPDAAAEASVATPSGAGSSPSVGLDSAA